MYKLNHNPFWRNTRTEKHRPDDPLSTDPPPPPAPASAAPRETGQIICEFCGCTLTRSKGEILKRGEAASRYLKHDDIVEAKDKEIRLLNEEITALKKERDALKGSTSPTSHRVGQRVS